MHLDRSSMVTDIVIVHRVQAASHHEVLRGNGAELRRDRADHAVVFSAGLAGVEAVSYSSGLIHSILSGSFVRAIQP